MYNAVSSLVMSECSLLLNRRWVRQQGMRLCVVTGGMTVCTE